MVEVIRAILCCNKIVLFFDAKTASLIGAEKALHYNQLGLNGNGSSDENLFALMCRS